MATIENPTINDCVNSPSHYQSSIGGVECITAIKSSMGTLEFFGYLKGNCLKYLWRYDKKGHAVEDLMKARWYLNKLIEARETFDTSIPQDFLHVKEN